MVGKTGRQHAPITSTSGARDDLATNCWGSVLCSMAEQIAGTGVDPQPAALSGMVGCALWGCCTWEEGSHHAAPAAHPCRTCSAPESCVHASTLADSTAPISCDVSSTRCCLAAAAAAGALARPPPLPPLRSLPASDLASSSSSSSSTGALKAVSVRCTARRHMRPMASCAAGPPCCCGGAAASPESASLPDPRATRSSACVPRTGNGAGASSGGSERQWLRTGTGHARAGLLQNEHTHTPHTHG